LTCLVIQVQGEHRIKSYAGKKMTLQLDVFAYGQTQLPTMRKRFRSQEQREIGYPASSRDYALASDQWLTVQIGNVERVRPRRDDTGAGHGRQASPIFLSLPQPR
jgi:hypothetical protein